MKTNTIDASPAGRQGHSGALAVCVAGALVGFSLAALVALTTWQMRHAGYDGLLRPNDSVTRAEVTKMLFFLL